MRLRKRVGRGARLSVWWCGGKGRWRSAKVVVEMVVVAMVVAMVVEDGGGQNEEETKRET